VAAGPSLSGLQRWPPAFVRGLLLLLLPSLVHGCRLGALLVYERQHVLLASHRVLVEIAQQVQ
jgi:GTP-sensing pleiotropic transcriptional regulator CodY